MGESAISLEGVDVRYGSVRALQHLTVSFEPGVTGLLGPNGAGKTTLIGVLAGLVRPTSGVVTIGDGPAGRRASRAGKRVIGLLPQRFSPPDRWTCAEVVAYSAWLRMVPRAKVSALAQTALEMVRLGDRAADPVRSLSGGMTQRLGIAAAVVHGPRVLLLDEPASGLDIEQRLLFRDIVRELPDQTTTLISSHLAEDVAALSDRIVVLERGSISFDGTTQRFCGTDSGHRPSAHDVERAYLELLGRAGSSRQGAP